MQQNYSKKIEPIQKTSKNTASSVLDASSQSEALQRKANMANNAAQREEAPRPNNTGMPDNLKSGIESLSGFSMDDVRVHYNSSKPATVQALAYTQGTDIHVAPGQEKHLPHEAWHVAQQMAGRVSPTTNINGMPVNDNAALEHEADVMGEKAVTLQSKNKHVIKENKIPNAIQMEKRKNPEGLIAPYSNKQEIEGNQNSFNRDHIIPHDKLQEFCELLKNKKLGDHITFSYWGEKARKAYANGKMENEKRKKTGLMIDPFFDDTEVNDVNKFCWMPGNIFLAPCPKADDDGNTFDITFASAVDVNDANMVNSYWMAFQYMNAAISQKKLQLIYLAMDKLNQISLIHQDIWPLKVDNWLYDPRNDRSYAKKIAKDGKIIDNPRITTSNSLLSKKNSEKRKLIALKDVGKTDWVQNKETIWRNAKEYKTELKKRIKKLQENLNKQRAFYEKQNVNEDIVSQMTEIDTGIKELIKKRNSLGLAMGNYSCSKIEINKKALETIITECDNLYNNVLTNQERLWKTLQGNASKTTPALNESDEDQTSLDFDLSSLERL